MLLPTVVGRDMFGRRPKEDRPVTDTTQAATLRELLADIHLAGTLVSAAAARAIRQLDEQQRRAEKAGE